MDTFKLVSTFNKSTIELILHWDIKDGKPLVQRRDGIEVY